MNTNLSREDKQVLEMLSKNIALLKEQILAAEKTMTIIEEGLGFLEQ